MLLSIAFDWLVHNPLYIAGIWVVYKVTITTIVFKSHTRDKYEEVEESGRYSTETEARIKTHNEIKNNHMLADSVEERRVTFNGVTTWVIEVSYGIFKLLFLPFKL